MIRPITPAAPLRATACGMAVLSLALALSGCATGSGSGSSAASGTDAAAGNNIITSSTGPDALTPPIPGESLEARLARLEHDLAEMKLDYSVVRPHFERLVEREAELASRVEALEQALGGFTASIPQRNTSPRRDTAPAAATAAPAAAADKPGSRETASTAPLGLHLASYRSRERLKAGWQELKSRFPAELGRMQVRVQRITTKSGTFDRLIAGPVTSRTQAEGLCRALAARGTYCKPMPFEGTPPDG